MEVDWNLVLQGLAIIVGTAVAVLAIWGDRIRHWLTPPNLVVCLRREQSHVELISKRKTRYWHLEVSNSNAWNPATGVKVLIMKIERRQGDTWSVYDIGRIPLKWQFSTYGMNPTTFGPPQNCDLGSLVEGEPFKLATEFVPASCNTELNGGETIRVHIQAVGDNAQSSPLVIELTWDGNWQDDDVAMSHSLTTKVLSH